MVRHEYGLPHLRPVSLRALSNPACVDPRLPQSFFLFSISMSATGIRHFGPLASRVRGKVHRFLRGKRLCTNRKNFFPYLHLAMPYVGDSAFLLVCYGTIAPVTRGRWTVVPSGLARTIRTVYMVAVTRAISYIIRCAPPSCLAQLRFLLHTYFTLAARYISP